MELDYFILLQILVFTITGATARVFWSHGLNITLSTYVKEVSMPIVVAISLILVGRNHISFLNPQDKFEAFGYSMLMSAFGPEVIKKVKDVIINLVVSSVSDAENPRKKQIKTSDKGGKSNGKHNST